LCGAGDEDHQLGIFFAHKKISVAWRNEFVSDRMSYIILIGRWGIIIVTNVYAPCEAKSDDINDGLYEELGRVVVYQ
jgi:hypothetical protein